MKKLSVLLLSLITIPTYAQSVLGALGQHQDGLKSESPSSTKPREDVKPSTEVISSSSVKRCEENDQTSLPLAFVSSLIQKRDGALSFHHDPREGTLTVTSPDMIGNCSSMLQWGLKKPEIKGEKAYAVELKFKVDDECNAEGCPYKVAIVEKGEFKEYKTMTFKPTMKGFEECLQKSGVVSGGKVVPSAIYTSPVSEKFSGLDYSGNIYFLSHGPSTPMIKAKHGSFEQVYGCDYYEKTGNEVEKLLTLDDAEKARLDAEAAKLKECKVDEYSKLTDFIEKYESYSSQLGDIRDQLILEAARKSAEAIGNGKYTDEDLKVIADFEKYIVEPKVELAVSLYEEGLELEGDAKKAKQAELNKVLAEVAALNQKPYFLPAHTRKLISDGRFEEATSLNSLKLVLENHQRLGAKQNGVVITPEVARQRVMSARMAFSSALVKEKENYEIRTGQISGNSEQYAQLASRMRQNIQVRSQNFSQEIQEEYARVQPGGYCYRYFRNTQKCIQDSMERIQELQALLQHYNNIDTERAEEYDTKAKEYAELEAQGRRYIAAQNGEVVEEAPAPTPVDTTVPPQAPQQQPQQGMYTFDYNPGQAYNQAMMTPNQYQYPTNPYQNQNMFQQQQNPYGYNSQFGYGYNGYSQQQPYMGMNSGYNFNFNAGFGMGQQQNPYMYGQQQGYWQQPYQSYNMYSMYGR